MLSAKRLFITLFLSTLFLTLTTQTAHTQTNPEQACTNGIDSYYQGESANAKQELEYGFLNGDPNQFVNAFNYGLCAMGYGLILAEEGNVDGQLAALQSALSIFQELETFQYEGAIHLAIGFVYQSRGQYEDALVQYDNAIVAQQLANDQRGVASTLNNIGQIHESRGQYQDALRKYEEALSIWYAIENWAGVGNSLMGIATITYLMGQQDEALMQFEAVLEMAQEINDPVLEGSARNSLGNIYQTQGNITEALAQYEAALEIAQSSAFGLDNQIAPLNNIGTLYQMQSQYDKALAQYGAALEIARQLQMRREESEILTLIGEVYETQGQYLDAQIQYEAALIIQQDLGSLPDEASTRNSLAVLYASQGRFDEAIVQANHALTIAREIGDKQIEVTALNNYGTLLRRQGFYLEALSELQNALDIVRDIGEHQHLDSILNNIGGIYLTLGNPDEALLSYEESLAIARAANNRLAEGTTLNNMAIVYGMQGRTIEALQYLNPAFEIADEINNLKLKHATLVAMGKLHLDQGSHDVAAEKLKSALVIARDIKDRIGEGKALHGLGNVYFAQGEYALALAQYNLALTLQEAWGDQSGQGETLNSLGNVYQTQGRYIEATNLYTRSLQLLDQFGTQSMVATAKGNLAGSYSSQERYQEALALYESALAIVREIEEKAAEVVILNNVGELYRVQEQYDEALVQYKDALDIVKTLNLPEEEGFLYNNIGLTYLELEQYADALAPFENALIIQRETGSLIGEGITLHNLANLYAFQKQPNALETVLEALDILDTVRAQAGSDLARSGFASRFAGGYDSGVEIALLHKDDATAFHLSERARARSFLDQLNTQTIQLEDNELQVLFDAESNAYTRLISAQDTVARAVNSGASTIGPARRALEAAKTEHEQTVAEIEEQAPQLAALVPSRNNTLTLEDVQQELRELENDSALISYFLLDEGRNAIAFVVTADGFQIVDLPANHAQIREAVEGFYSGFQNPIEFNTAHSAKTTDLYNWLITPLLPHLNTQHLIIVPHQVLHYLPFGMLSTGEQYLDEQFTISYLPSASVLPFVEGKEGTYETALVFGNPPAEGLPWLESAETEATTIASLYNSRAYLTNAATETLFRTEAPIADIIHIAAHGVYDERIPLDGALYLAGDDTNDGLLKVSETFGLGLDSADLVVLSACETQLGRIGDDNASDNVSDGDEIVGLTRAFIFAGTPSIISTLWVVDDHSTTLLMERFHNNLRAGIGKAQALQEAQQYLRTTYPEYSDPYYWAGFVLNGDAGAIESNSPITQAPTLPPSSTPTLPMDNNSGDSNSPLRLRMIISIVALGMLGIGLAVILRRR